MYKVPSRVSFQISCILESFFDQCNVTTTTTPALSASSRDLSTTSRSYPAAKTNSSGGLNGSKCFEQASSTGNRWRFFQSLEDSLIGTQFCFKVNSDAIKLFIFFIDDYTANIWFFSCKVRSMPDSMKLNGERYCGTVYYWMKTMLVSLFYRPFWPPTGSLFFFKKKKGLFLTCNVSNLIFF